MVCHTTFVFPYKITKFKTKTRFSEVDGGELQLAQPVKSLKVK